DRTAEGPCVAEQCGDVSKQNAGLGIIGNGADSFFQILLKSHWCYLVPIAVYSISHCEEREPRSNPVLSAGLLRGACHRTSIGATRWLAMTADVQLTGPLRRKAFSTIRRPTSPPSDISDSGWNCTPPTGKDLCSMAMATPSSVVAVTDKTSGTLSRSTKSE